MATAQEWQPHIQDWQASGLSPAADCRQHRLNPKTVNGWRRRYRAASAPARRARAGPRGGGRPRRRQRLSAATGGRPCAGTPGRRRPGRGRGVTPRPGLLPRPAARWLVVAPVDRRWGAAGLSRDARPCGALTRALATPTGSAISAATGSSGWSGTGPGSGGASGADTGDRSSGHRPAPRGSPARRSRARARGRGRWAAVDRCPAGRIPARKRTGSKWLKPRTGAGFRGGFQGLIRARTPPATDRQPAPLGRVRPPG